MEKLLVKTGVKYLTEGGQVIELIENINNNDIYKFQIKDGHTLYDIYGNSIHSNDSDDEFDHTLDIVSVYVKNLYWFVSFIESKYLQLDVHRNKILDNIHPFKFIYQMNVEGFGSSINRCKVFTLTSFQEITEEDFLINMELLANSDNHHAIPINYKN